MFKYWKFYLLKKLVGDPIVASQIYHMLYNGGQPPRVDYKIEVPSIPQTSPKSVSGTKIDISSKKTEMMEALNFLRTKTYKSKQDKESISILEAALKNEK